ncbi:hypothetical protein SNE40_004223 [Patella caerulea]|uniref:Uncharacterized protein n=1 Tax=Patella caerulea TaxID=87958 RepID=A0AAN8QGF7_PATCE
MSGNGKVTTSLVIPRINQREKDRENFVTVYSMMPRQYVEAVPAEHSSRQRPQSRYLSAVSILLENQHLNDSFKAFRVRRRHSMLENQEQNGCSSVQEWTSEKCKANATLDHNLPESIKQDIDTCKYSIPKLNKVSIDSLSTLLNNKYLTESFETFRSRRKHWLQDTRFCDTENGHLPMRSQGSVVNERNSMNIYLQNQSLEKAFKVFRVRRRSSAEWVRPMVGSSVAD